MSWELKQNLKNILAQESGTQIFTKGSRRAFAFMYPNTYNIGMSNLGLHILYRIINDRGDTACERVFLPDDKDLKTHHKTKTALCSLETQRLLSDFEIIGVMMSFEMDYANLYEMLRLGNVTLRAEARKRREPFVIIGGPCATFNPEPLAEVADAFVIGEGEEVINELLDVYYEVNAKADTREEVLLALAQIDGVYVPRFYTPQYDENENFVAIQADERVLSTVKRRWVRDLDAFPNTSAIMTAGTEFENMFIVEVARGCGRHCRFCMAGYCFRKPRERSLELLLDKIAARPDSTAKVGLMGAAVSDYTEIKALTKTLIDENVPFTVASLRADSLDEELTKALAGSGQQTMTVAPEAGSVKMRAVINKGITEEDIYRAAELAAAAGMKNLKLYYMIGLPGEEEEDIDEMIAMILRIRKRMNELGNKGNLIISANSFIPKPFTPFQWEPLCNVKVLKKRLKYIESALRKEKSVRWQAESLKETVVQSVLARGTRKIGALYLQAFEEGKSFKDYLREQSIKIDELAEKSFEPGGALPWKHLDMGFTEEYLLKERKLAEEQKATIRCFDGCKRCGVCK